MISQNPIFYNCFLYRIFNFVFFSGMFPFKTPLLCPFPCRFCLPFSVLRRNGIGVLLGVCGGLLLVLHGRLGFPFCCRFRRSGVCGGCHLCRLGCGIAGGLACSGLCWVSGLRLIFLLGLFGFLFRFGLLGKAAILQGKIGICNVHHQITGTGTIASVLNANANGDLRIIRRCETDKPCVSLFSLVEFCGSCLPCHLVGIPFQCGSRSHIDHLYALLQMAKDKGLTRVYIHCFLDGRDVSPTSGKGFVQALADKCAALGVGRIATVMGRYYAMDRDKRWERVQMAYDAMVYGEGNHNADPVDAVARSYANNVTDEFVEPVVCDSDGTISDNDSVIFFNYRPDRAREITRAIVDPDFDGFQREYFPTTYVCNTEYDASMPNVLVAWPRIAVKNGLGEYLSSMGMTQLRIAETEKYAHVTFFFNGGVEKQYPGEDRVLVASPKVATYDLQPEMSAVEVCDKCVERIESGAYDVIILNFANCDMVGHTGVLEAAIKAVETVDTCVGRVVEATLKMGGIAMVTADHGNAEDMKQPDGSPMTAHTTNPVPFILCGAGTELRPGRLADIAPTILDVMGLACPEEMGGKTLIVK